MLNTIRHKHFFKVLTPLLFAALLLSGCFEPEPAKPLKRTYWSLIELKGEDVPTVANQPHPHLLFHINDASVHGSDGCNRIQGEYARDKEKFSMTQISTTRMQCAEGMDQANAFVRILSQTDRIKIEEDNLILYRLDIELARFKAMEAY